MKKKKEKKKERKGSNHPDILVYPAAYLSPFFSSKTGQQAPSIIIAESKQL